MPVIEIDPERCSACHRCTEVCPTSIFAGEDKDSAPGIEHVKMCIACGHCVAICPHDAISHGSYPDGTVVSVKRKHLPSEKQVFEMLRARRSVRAFKDAQVEKEAIERVIEAARFAPSAHNRKNTEYTVVQDRVTLDAIVGSTIDYLESIRRSLRELPPSEGTDEVREVLWELEVFIGVLERGKDCILWGAPVFVAFHSGDPDVYTGVNANLALANATLAAMSLGLGGFYTGFVVMASRADRTIPGLLSMPEGNKMHAGLALGHPRYKYKKWVQREPANVTWI